MAMRLPGMHRNILETNESLRVFSEKQDERDKDYKRGYEDFYSMLHQIRADTQNIVARENNRQNSLRIREQETGQVITRNEVLQILLESKSRADFPPCFEAMSLTVGNNRTAYRD
jgi:hypothetical protein